MNIIEEILRFSENQDAYIDSLVSDWAKVEKKAVGLILELLAEANKKDGVFTGEDVNEITAKFITEIEKVYNLAAKPYDRFLNAYNEDFSKIIDLTERLNYIKLQKTKLNDYQKQRIDFVTEQISKGGYRTWFVSPMQKIITNQLLGGASVTESRQLFRTWLNEKKSSIFQDAKQLQSLERYGSQIVFDAVYQSNGFVQQAAQEDNGFEYFLYIGSLVGNSRELCKHLIGQNGGLWEIKEIPKLLQTYPDGTIKGTNIENFFVLRGGYSCRHRAFAIRDKEVAKKYL